MTGARAANPNRAATLPEQRRPEQRTEAAALGDQPAADVGVVEPLQDQRQGGEDDGRQEPVGGRQRPRRPRAPRRAARRRTRARPGARPAARTGRAPRPGPPAQQHAGEQPAAGAEQRDDRRARPGAGGRLLVLLDEQRGQQHDDRDRHQRGQGRTTPPAPPATAAPGAAGTGPAGLCWTGCRARQAAATGSLP